MTKKKYVVDEVRDGRYVRAWWNTQRELIVQVWNAATPDGEPAGDWAMPGMLGEVACIEQAMLQTPA
jgi:hypothetical protein